MIHPFSVYCAEQSMKDDGWADALRALSHQNDKLLAGPAFWHALATQLHQHPQVSRLGLSVEGLHVLPRERGRSQGRVILLRPPARWKTAVWQREHQYNLGVPVSEVYVFVGALVYSTQWSIGVATKQRVIDQRNYEGLYLVDIPNETHNYAEYVSDRLTFYLTKWWS